MLKKRYNIGHKDRGASMKYRFYFSTCCVALIFVHSPTSLFLFLFLPLSPFLVSSSLRHRYTLCDPIALSCPTVAQVCDTTRVRAWLYWSHTLNVDRINIQQKEWDYRNDENFMEKM